MPQAVLIPALQAGIPAVAGLGSAFMQDRTNRKAMNQQQASNASALAFERQKYEEEKALRAEDMAIRRAARQKLFDMWGIPMPAAGGGMPSAGGSPVTLGALAPRPGVRPNVRGQMPAYAATVPPELALDAEQADPNTWE